MRQLWVVIGCLLLSATSHAATLNGSGSGLPPTGAEGDCLLTTSGAWGAGACPGAGTGAPTGAQYWTGAADATLSAEKNLGALGTGLVINTTGTPSIYAGATCTNQVLRILSASGAGTCNTITSAFVDATIALTGNSLAQFAATTSAQLAGVLSDETGSGGGFVRATAPTIDSPIITTKMNSPSVTAFPGTPSVGDVVIVTDDSASGACDSAAGSAVTQCRWNGSAWAALGDGNSGSGAPTNATYLVQTANGSLTNEQALGALGTGCMGSTTATGVVATRTITGTANQITVTSGDCSGNPTLSIPTNPTLSGTVSATAFTATGASSGIVQMNGLTSGAFKLTTPDATGQTVTLQPAAQTSGAATFTLQDAAGVNQTIATLAQTQTLSNKTLTSPIIASISNTGTLTLPTATDTLVGRATTDTLTNKTVDAEGTGNTFTIPRRLWFPAAGCNNATAGSVWDLPTSSPAVAACKTGTNTQMGVLDFADGSNLSAQVSYKLPSTWTGTVDANIKWLTSATTGNVVWQVATICVADAETDDPAFNTASTVTDAAKGTTLQTNDASITTVTVTGCAAGELMHVKLFRDSAHASDTLAATARLIGLELVVREAL